MKEFHKHCQNQYLLQINRWQSEAMTKAMKQTWHDGWKLPTCVYNDLSSVTNRFAIPDLTADHKYSATLALGYSSSLVIKNGIRYLLDMEDWFIGTFQKKIVYQIILVRTVCITVMFNSILVQMNWNWFLDSVSFIFFCTLFCNSTNVPIHWCIAIVSRI